MPRAPGENSYSYHHREVLYSNTDVAAPGEEDSMGRAQTALPPQIARRRGRADSSATAKCQTTRTPWAARRQLCHSRSDKFLLFTTTAKCSAPTQTTLQRQATTAPGDEDAMGRAQPALSLSLQQIPALHHQCKVLFSNTSARRRGRHGHDSDADNGNESTRFGIKTMIASSSTLAKVRGRCQNRMEVSH